MAYSAQKNFDNIEQTHSSSIMQRGVARIIYLANIIYYIHKNPRNMSGVNPSIHGTLASFVSVKRMFTISIKPLSAA